MSLETTHAAQQLLTGATVGGGSLAWLTTNSPAITAMAIVTTAIASIYFGRASKRIAARNADAAEERNRINDDSNRLNKRDITNDIVDDLFRNGKSDKYVCDFLDNIKK